MLPNHVILCQPLSFCPQSFPAIRVFSNESVLRIRWPKCWSFNFSIHISNEYSGLISFRIDWFDLLAAQGTLKSILQNNNSKPSILYRAQPSSWSNSHIHTWLLLFAKCSIDHWAHFIVMCSLILVLSPLGGYERSSTFNKWGKEGSQGLENGVSSHS